MTDNDNDDPQDKAKSKKSIAAPQNDGSAPVGDVFDNLDALRVSQNYGSGLKTSRPFTQCTIRKPRDHEWFRVSRDLVFETMLFEHKEEMSAEWYLPIGPVVQAELEGRSPPSGADPRLDQPEGRPAHLGRQAAGPGR